MKKYILALCCLISLNSHILFAADDSMRESYRRLSLIGKATIKASQPETEQLAAQGFVLAVTGLYVNGPDPFAEVLEYLATPTNGLHNAGALQNSLERTIHEATIANCAFYCGANGALALLEALLARKGITTAQREGFLINRFLLTRAAHHYHGSDIWADVSQFSDSQVQQLGLEGLVESLPRTRDDIFEAIGDKSFFHKESDRKKLRMSGSSFGGRTPTGSPPRGESDRKRLRTGGSSAGSYSPLLSPPNQRGLRVSGPFSLDSRSPAHSRVSSAASVSSDDPSRSRAGSQTDFHIRKIGAEGKEACEVQGILLHFTNILSGIEDSTTEEFQTAADQTMNFLAHGRYEDKLFSINNDRPWLGRKTEPTKIWALVSFAAHARTEFNFDVVADDPTTEEHVKALQTFYFKQRHMPFLSLVSALPRSVSDESDVKSGEVELSDEVISNRIAELTNPDRVKDPKKALDEDNELEHISSQLLISNYGNRISWEQAKLAKLKNTERERKQAHDALARAGKKSQEEQERKAARDKQDLATYQALRKRFGSLSGPLKGDLTKAFNYGAKEPVLGMLYLAEPGQEGTFEDPVTKNYERRQYLILCSLDELYAFRHVAQRLSTTQRFHLENLTTRIDSLENKTNFTQINAAAPGSLRKLIKKFSITPSPADEEILAAALVIQQDVPEAPPAPSAEDLSAFAPPPPGPPPSADDLLAAATPVTAPTVKVASFSRKKARRSVTTGAAKPGGAGKLNPALVAALAANLKPRDASS